MKWFLLKRRRWLPFVGLIGLIVLCAQVVHPFGAVKQSSEDRVNVNGLSMPAEVNALFVRSCQDCHSDQTVWPWYSYAAPVSWLVERDVSHGRDHMNFSHWPQYSLQQQGKLLADIASVVKNHEMPLPQYALIHRNAKLSDAETDILYKWARLERRKVKAALSGSLRLTVSRSR